MSRPISSGDYVEHFDPGLAHHRAWLQAVLEQLVAHAPPGLAGWRSSRGPLGSPCRSVAAGCWMTEAAIHRHRGGSQTPPDVVFSTIPNPPPELQELRLRLREVLAKIGYCMAAGMGTDEQVLRHDLSVEFPDEGTEVRLAAPAAALESIADEAEVAAVQAVCEHVLLPDPPVTS